MKEAFKVGDKVFDYSRGWGEVYSVDSYGTYCVNVQFENTADCYTALGKDYVKNNKPTLSFTEYTLDNFSQERPCEFKEGDSVWVKDAIELEWRPRIFAYADRGLFFTFTGVSSFSGWDECKPF